MDNSLIITIGAIVGGVTILYLQIKRRLDELDRKEKEQQDSIVVNLNQRVDDLTKNVSESLQKVTDTLLRQMSDNTKQVDARLEATQQNRQKSEQEIQRIIREVTQKLAQMQESNQKIFDVGKDIASLQEILRAPKLRGTLGELFLGDLLAQIFPTDRFQLQYSFKSGEAVDAIIKLRDGRLVPIDAKFPLESFKRMIEVETDEEKRSAKREFVKSVKLRIDEIASKYILTDEGTLDFALMYIPAENVYYETIIKGDEGNDIISYAYGKRVIPVSPNNLYVYLQTIALGLRGMQIEERAKEILADLSRLNVDFNKVAESYEVLGKHINNALGKYEDTSRLLGRFGAKVEQIEEKTEPETQQQTLVEIEEVREVKDRG